MESQIALRNPWVTFAAIMAGVLMIVLDTTIVNVALPSIQTDLGLSDSGLTWVVNAYLLAFGSLLILAGRLADLFGTRRMFLIGVVVFTLASLACGLAPNAAALLAARAIQGIGGAILSAVSLAIVMNMFQEPSNRAKAMGFYTFVAAGGGAIGMVLGGALTNAFDWHWNFLINVPIGIAVFAIVARRLPRDELGNGIKLDYVGASTITFGLLTLVYAMNVGNVAGWASPLTLGLIAASLALFAAFILTQQRVSQPLMPLRLFSKRSLSVACTAGALWAAAMFAWFFLGALYMQLVLGYSPLQVGMSFLPANIIMAVFSVGLSAMIAMKIGFRIPVAIGLLLAGVGLTWFAFAPIDGKFLTHVLPPMLILGTGAGMAMNPIFLAAMQHVDQQDSGLASGIVNTAFMMGGALGLAALAAVATAQLQAASATQPVVDALLSGYHAAFAAGAGCAVVAALLIWFLLPHGRPQPHAMPGEESAPEAA